MKIKPTVSRLSLLYSSSLSSSWNGSSLSSSTYSSCMLGSAFVQQMKWLLQPLSDFDNSQTKNNFFATSSLSLRLSKPALIQLQMVSFMAVVSLAKFASVVTNESIHSCQHDWNTLLKGLLRHTSSSSTLLVQPQGIPETSTLLSGVSGRNSWSSWIGNKLIMRRALSPLIYCSTTALNYM